MTRSTSNMLESNPLSDFLDSEDPLTECYGCGRDIPRVYLEDCPFCGTNTREERKRAHESKTEKVLRLS